MGLSAMGLSTTDQSGASATRLTTALNPAIKQSDLVEASVIRYTSFDGTKIPSILYKPKDATASNKVPALVLVHGGPGGQTTKGYRAMVQHLVNHGYAVLGANNRGSSGYGKTFFHMDDKAHGEGDLQDIIWGRKYLESLDWVDAEKVGIIGGSYGGYMVAAALAFEPDSFDVGIDIFGVTNWVRTLKPIPPWWESFCESLYDEMGDPATDEERHRRISPLFHAANIKKPLMVIQCANDPHVLQLESDELVASVKANGVAVEYVVFADEGHGFRGKNNRITASEAYLKFLDTYLKAGVDK
jgi:dipeptidyl aminopeptidase/acylaminoacyl peptidase